MENTHPNMSRSYSKLNNGPRRRNSKRVSDENVAPNRRSTGNQLVSQPVTHKTSDSCWQDMPTLEVRGRESVSSTQTFRDITNTATTSSVSDDKANERFLATSVQSNGDCECASFRLSQKPEVPRISHSIDAPFVPARQEAKRRRQLSVSRSHDSELRRLPSAVVVTIFEMAGFKFDRPECEYASANLKNDLKREAQNMPRQGCMAEQRSLNGRMRAILIDWIAQVLGMSRLSRRTFFLAVNLIDRCFSCMQVDKMNLQLLGSTAFLIAAKVEEIYPPDVANLVYICDGAYTADQLMAMECTILQNLDFRVDGPTVEHFLPHFIAACQSRKFLGPDPVLSCGLASLWQFSAASESDESRNGVAWYFAELALLDIHMSQYPPSLVSAAALFLASNLKRTSTDVEILMKVSGYTEPMLVKCASDLDRLRTAALSDSLQQINQRHADAVNATRHAVFQPWDPCPYAAVASSVPYPCSL